MSELWLIPYLLGSAAFSAVLVWSKPWSRFWLGLISAQVSRSGTVPWWGELVTCPVCLGFWMGLAWAFALGLNFLGVLGFAALTALLAKPAYRVLEG